MIRGTLYYFSGTGNTLKITRDLAIGLGYTEIVPISLVLKQEAITTKADRVGILFPVYMGGMPLAVSKFIKKLKLNPDQYVFGIATYGGNVVDSLRQLKSELKAVGIKLSAGFGFKMPGNYTPFYGAIPLEEQKKMFAMANSKITEIIPVIKEGRPDKVARGPLIADFLFSLVYVMCAHMIPKMDKSFWINDKCNSCGVCKRVCPVGNIEIKDGKPVWLHKCEQCLACLHWCPEEAIQFGKNTAGKKRYRHPDVSVKDFFDIAA